MKKIFVALFLILVFTISLGVVYARVIPGIDEPYNPPAYYSPTAISYEDSPSPFALFDLARQGGEVYDPTLHAKFIDEVANLVSWFNNVMNLLQKGIIDSTPLNADFTNATKQGIDKIDTTTIKAWKTSETSAFMENKYFRAIDKYDNDGTANYDPIEQTKEIEKIYKSFAESLDEIQKTEDEEHALIMRIQEASKTAKGEMEILQLQAQLDAVQSALNRKKNMLLSLYLDFKNVENKIKEDEVLRKAQNYYEKSLIITDPYDRTELQKMSYTRPEGIGFVNMK